MTTTTDPVVSRLTFNKTTTTDSAGRPKYNVLLDGQYIGRIERDSDGDWAARTAVGTVAWKDTRREAGIQMAKHYEHFVGSDEPRSRAWAAATYDFLRDRYDDAAQGRRMDLRKEYRQFRRNHSAVEYINTALGYLDGATDAAAYLRSAIALIETR